MKLTKQQVTALATQIYNNINFDTIKAKKQKEWLKSNESLEYRKTMRPLFLKAKELIEKYGFDRIDIDSHIVRSDTREENFFTCVTYGYGNNCASWQFKIRELSRELIENEIILASIDAKTVEEITNTISKKYI